MIRSKIAELLLDTTIHSSHGKLVDCVGEQTGDTDPEYELASTKTTRPNKLQAVGKVIHQISSDVTASCETTDNDVLERLRKMGDSNVVTVEGQMSALFIVSRSTISRINTLLMHVMRDTIMLELSQNDSRLEGGEFTIAESQSSSMLYNEEIVISMRVFVPGVTTLVMGLIPNGMKEVEDDENKIIKMAKLNIMVRSALRNHFGNDVSMVDPINEIPCVQLSREESNPNACPGPVVGEMIPCNNY